MKYGYRPIVITVPSGHQINYIKMGFEKLSPDEANELAQFCQHCCEDAADGCIEFMPEDMSLETWYNNTYARIGDFVEV